jgi:hypothetical protein
MLHASLDREEPVHVPYEVAKRIAACEYAAVILRDHLRRIAETADRTVDSAALPGQGLLPQDSGGVHAAAIASAAAVSGGDHRV